MPKSGVTHDLVIEDHDTRHRRGFMYARARGGRRPFDSREAQPVAPRQLTMGELTHAEDPPTISLTLFMDTWIKGIGGKDWRTTEDRGKLADSTNIETYPHGTLRPGRDITATTVSANHPGAGYGASGFAVATNDATPGTAGIENELWCFVESRVFYGGDNNWTSSSTPLDVDVLYKNGVRFGKWVVAPGWNSFTDVVDSPMPYIYKDPTTATWTSSTELEGRFKFFAVARNNAGQEILWGGHNIADTNINVNGTHADDATTLNTTADPRSAISVGDLILCGNPSNGAAQSQEIMLVTATGASSLTVVRGYGVAAQTYTGTGSNIYLYQPHVIRSSADPSNSGSWSSATAIGDQNAPITGLLVDEDTDTLLIAKTDGLWQQYYEPLEDGGRLFLRNLTIQFRDQNHPNNFLGLYSWNKRVLLPLGGGGLMEYSVSSGEARDISFRLTADELTELHGRVLAITSNSETVYIALKDASVETIYILAGNLVSVEGNTDWSWAKVTEISAATDQTFTDNRTTLWYDSVFDDHSRVWLGYTESGASATPKFLPVRTGDKSDTYTTSGEAVFLRYDANLPRVNKHFSRMEVESKNLGAGGRQWTFSYRLDGETTYTAWNAVTVSPLQTLEFPTGVSGKIIQIKAEPSQTSASATPPELVSIRLISQIHPDPTKVYPVSLYLADHQSLLNGAEGGRVKGDLAQLESWNAGASDVTLHTPDGESKSVIFMPGSMTKQESYKETGRRSEFRVNFLLAEVG